MTQALARKWRPKTFSELVGQEHVVKALTHALEQNRLHHAYLFTGTRGVGKTTIARIIAKALNCETGISAAPCGVCNACREIDSGRFVDLLELDAASNTQVDNMRELLESALYAPSSARFKVYIIDEVHMLSKSAFNAMLKTLEEPPEHIKFILATTDPQKIPVTVLSRCLQFNLKQIPAQQISAQLQKILTQEQVQFEIAAVNLIARAAQGSMRDSLSLLDQAIAHGGGKVQETMVREMLGAVDQTYLYAILKSLAAHDGVAMIAQADQMLSRSLSFEMALQDLASLLHRIALAQTVPDAIDAEDTERLSLLELAKLFHPEDVQLYYQIAIQGRDEITLAPDEYAGFTMCLLRMLAFAPETNNPMRVKDKSGQASNEIANTSRTKMGEATTLTSQQSVVFQNKLKNEDWPYLINSINVGGMAKMLAQHCELKSHEGANLTLCVPELHKHLLEAAYRDKLRTALEQYFKQRLNLSFVIGDSSGNTPAEIENREKQIKQAHAIAAIEQDPFVRELVEEFDARLIQGAIKPLS